MLTVERLLVSDTTIGTLNRLAVSGCRVAIYDATSRRIARIDADGVKLLGGGGRGPGEFQRVVAIALAPNGDMHVLDSGRRRHMVMSQEGGLIADDSLPTYPAKHGAIGALAIDGDGRWYDYPLGGEQTGTTVPWDSIAAYPLVRAFDAAGHEAGAWGRAELPPGDRTGVVQGLARWQQGQVLIDGDSLWIWRTATGRLERFARNHSSRDPVRSQTVTPMRPVQLTLHERSFVDSTGIARVDDDVVQAVGGPAAIDGDGRLYLILYGAMTDEQMERDVWPPEFLRVIARDGRLIGTWALPTRYTRGLGIRRDGDLLALAHPNVNSDDWQLLRVLGSPQTAHADPSRCASLK